MAAAVAAAPGTGAVLVRPRLWVDLLSSQPLCFNAFGELAEDLELAARVLGRLWPGLVSRVLEIRFEHSPGAATPPTPATGAPSTSGSLLRVRGLHAQREEVVEEELLHRRPGEGGDVADTTTWLPLHLERFFDAAEEADAGAWVREVRHRYVGPA